MQVTGSNRMAKWAWAFAALLAVGGFGLATASAKGPGHATVESADEIKDPVKRGAYLFNAGNCLSCHTDTKNNGAPLAGGLPMASPFGTFYTPNISPDPVNGIGKWTDEDFIRAFRHGISPSGSYYYPSFPFTSFTNMTDEDIKALRAYLMTQPAQKAPNKDHDLTFPISIRSVAMTVWRSLFFTPGPYVYDRAMDAVWNRGAYLVNGVAHCGECHTPRNFMGAMDSRNRLAGGVVEDKKAPDITSGKEHGIGKWSMKDLTGFLENGITPAGDVVGGKMGDVVKEIAKLTADDRAAIAVYLKSVPAPEVR